VIEEADLTSPVTRFLPITGDFSITRSPDHPITRSPDVASNPTMRWSIWLGVLAVALLFTPSMIAGTPGSFRGVLMEGADTKPGWMYVQSRNDFLRRVKITRASVSYGDEVPAGLRQANPRMSLRPGAEVRILAEQDSHGDWRAQKIEILRLSSLGRAQQ
jgi:hypothetical protein